MDFDLGRSPPAALAALRTVEDVVHRVSFGHPPARDADRSGHLADPHPSGHPPRRRRQARCAAATRSPSACTAARCARAASRTSPTRWRSRRSCAELGMDTTTLVAALLHDTVEDTSYTMAQLRDDFGGEVALLVDGVTKFDRGFYGATAEVETIRKMIVAAGVDVRVLIVKLADRLHNMRTHRRPLARLPGPHRPGHPGGADPAVRPARHPGAQARARGHGARRARAGRVRGSADLGGEPSGVERLHRRGSSTGRRPRCKTAKIAGRVIARPHHLLLDLEGHVRQGPPDPVRAAPHRDHRRRGRERLLHRPRRGPQRLAAGARAGSRTSSPRRRTTSTAPCTPR